MKKIVKEKDSVDRLADEILRFTEDIECLDATLPLFMHLLSLLGKDAGEKLSKYINEHAVSRRKNGEKVYILKVEDVREYDRLKRSSTHFSNSSRLIPRHFITSLISQYDSFLSKIIRFIFTVKPEILNASEKSLMYTDLIQFKDIASAREFIIEKEIEGIIRKSHAEQFEWLRNKMQKPFNKNLESWPIFVEVTERRNLFVHCDGKVSAQYLSICKEHHCKINPDIKIGDELHVPAEYAKEASQCIFEIGVKLSQVIWRKLCPSEVDRADKNIIRITFNLIDKGQHHIAINLLDFFTDPTIKHSSESYRLMMILNKAQAYKWINDNAKCNEIIDNEDWSASEDQFKLAVSVLKDNYEEAYDFMLKLKHDKSFHKANYKDWPLFKKMRVEQKFKDVYKKCYKETFSIEKNKEIKETNKSNLSK